MSDADCVVLTRPTESLAMFLQQPFRAMSYREGETTIIPGHANNIALHGEIDHIITKKQSKEHSNQIECSFYFLKIVDKCILKIDNWILM